MRIIATIMKVNNLIIKKYFGTLKHDSLTRLIKMVHEVFVESITSFYISLKDSVSLI